MINVWNWILEGIILKLGLARWNGFPAPVWRYWRPWRRRTRVTMQTMGSTFLTDTLGPLWQFSPTTERKNFTWTKIFVEILLKGFVYKIFFIIFFLHVFYHVNVIHSIDDSNIVKSDGVHTVNDKVSLAPIVMKYIQL